MSRPARLETTPEHLAHRRRALRRFHTVEIAAYAITMLAILVLMLTLPAEADARSDETTRAVFGILFVLCAHWAVMLRLGFALTAEPRNKLRRKLPFRGWILTATSPVAALLIVLPWILSGALGGDPPAETAALLLLAFLLAAGLGILAAVGVLLPIELAVRGLVGLSLARSTPQRSEAAGSLRFAGALASTTVFCLVVAGGVNFGSSGRAAWGSVILALIGIPGDYTIANSWMLWVGRAVFWGFVIWLVIDWLRTRRAS